MGSLEIAICGIGAVTGYGWGRDRLWEGLSSGKHAARLEGGYGPDCDELAWVIRVPEGGEDDDGPTRFAKSVRAAAREAVLDAFERGWRPGPRVGVVHGEVLHDTLSWAEFYASNRFGRVRDYLSMMPSTAPSMFMKEFDFHGPSLAVGAMCASGNAALITAKTWLDAGIVDDVVCIATDLTINPQQLWHMVRLGVVVADADPLTACRPFQEGSRGFPMAEGSAAFVLSKRSDRPYARALGGAITQDAYHVISIDPDLDQLRACYTKALADAGVSGSDIRYVNAHGPGTAQCDRAESMMLEEFFTPETGIYSVKPLVGHCQGAAAGVELAVAAMAYERGYLPAPPRVAPGHPQLISGKTPIGDGLTLKSSLGMGGNNTAVVLAPAA
ncbi:MAG TPA: beta-ketoacyl synthase N-terminal-like domain-containing protein [Amycolatopsis sp.]|uniref:beta-ketoacyl synthase N-terminal-like domain-containing protein n=1 Tax=Amycolatopsis sp. TaxID=37632 RepID=UPI002B45B47E|nr:beta-ketoacyl synthase N-terminal-like domain-containing protein [Amycolatopsis sp.]HKS45427.1 beta-ketoacyl synthase N-terminal-like domain-containing protein [Amycolatopsis sp.]